VDIDIKKSGDPVIKVHLDSNDRKVRASLPQQLDGYPVEYVYTGPIRKQS